MSHNEDGDPCHQIWTYSDREHGLAVVHEDTCLNFVYKFKQADRVQVLTLLRSPTPDSPVHEVQILQPSDVPRNEQWWKIPSKQWFTVSIPLSRLSNPVSRERPTESFIATAFNFRPQDHACGLVIDGMWLARGTSKKIEFKPLDSQGAEKWSRAKPNKEEPTMKPQFTFVGSLILFASLASVLTPADDAPKRIGGKLDLRLGHLCDQRGCVEHSRNSLSAVSGLAAVDPRPSLKKPSATLYLRKGRAIDVWSLRENLRDQSIEIMSLVPGDLSGYRLRVELPRWKGADALTKVQQSRNCRDAAAGALEASPLVNTSEVSGGGIDFTPKRDDVDLIEILETITKTGVAPRAVWLVPANVAMPKASPPRVIKPDVEPKSGGSPSHAVVEFEFARKCDAGPTLSAMIGRPSWASRTRFESGKVTTARTSITDRKHAALSPLLAEFRSAGHLPRHIRLRGFRDVRIYLEFAHICGDIVYSNPPKAKKTGKGRAEKEKNPPVRRALHPAASSNGRKAIQRAIESVPWIKDAVFFDYHTRFQFRGGPKKVLVAFQPKGADVVRLDDLIDALRRAGFPPKSVMVSRRFPGLPFAGPLPGELLLTDRDGKEKPLFSLKQPGRPLALAFVSLQCKRHKKYQADPSFYKPLSESIDKYKDRVDFVTVAANPDDKFEDVVAFLAKTKLPIPLHDAKRAVRAAFNAQETPAPHFYIFDRDGLFRFAGDPHDNWAKPNKNKDDYLARALDLVLAGKYAENGAAFYNKTVCNCSHPKCKCSKCGCGPSCRCGSKH